MRTLNEYLQLPYRLEIVPDVDEGGYVASYPDLPGCMTCADTMDRAVAQAEDAKKEWMIVAMEGGITIPEPDDIEGYSGQFKLRIPKSLHRQLVQQARREGISMNQYCVYMLSQNAMVMEAKQE